MASLITHVDKEGPSAGIIFEGDRLLAIDGHPITDVLDYMYYQTGRRIEVTVEGGDGKVRLVRIKKAEYEDLGLDFDDFLMDRQRGCVNKCIFCFVDQLPKGMRQTLYFKDDDTRMSLLTGSYVTLTNLSESEIRRIVSLGISPLGISVHSTDDGIRAMMLGNRRAEPIMPILERFAAAGITMNCQVVLCRGINDGEHLKKTLWDLISLYPQMASVSVVPVGLTKHREGLFPLDPFDRTSATDAVRTVELIGDEALAKYGSRICYPADELYIRAEMDLPPGGFYEDYPQLENGVGLCALLKDEFADAFEAAEPSAINREVTIITGMAAAPILQGITDVVKSKYPGVEIEILAVKNDFFGESVDVAGLITGRDLLLALESRKLSGDVLIPSVMLRYDGDMFLDDLPLSELEDRYQIRVVERGGEELLAAILGR